MLYRNNVIKYGLVGPRGAWIAGGIEFSFPYAHTTNTVSNVESALHRNADGSATAFVGAIDWVSNMYWQIALTLRPGTASLEERVTALQRNAIEQSLSLLDEHRGARHQRSAVHLPHARDDLRRSVRHRAKLANVEGCRSKLVSE
jgi:Domain of unknown function (DUF5107)